MKKKFIIRLTDTERQALRDLVRKGKAAAYRRTHAQILLLADESENGPGLRDGEVATRVEVHERTVSRLRQRCVEQGLEWALERQPRKRERSRVLDGEGVDKREESKGFHRQLAIYNRGCADKAQTALPGNI